MRQGFSAMRIGGAMRKAIFSIVAAACLFIGGCAPVMSLFSLYDKNTLTNNDQIVGNWESNDKDDKNRHDCCFVFAKSGDGYSMTVPDPDDKEIWYSTVHLVKLGDAMFVDIEPNSDKPEQTTRIPFPTIKVHAFGRIWIEKDSLRMELLDDDGMKTAVASGKTRLTYVNGDDGLVLTSTTEQMQAFAREHADDKGAFSFEISLQRKR
jgi:hypothetical protein